MILRGTARRVVNDGESDESVPRRLVIILKAHATVLSQLAFREVLENLSLRHTHEVTLKMSEIGTAIAGRINLGKQQ